MIGILSDAHGNVEGFKLAIRHLETLGAKRFVYLGDAVGYIPSLEVLKELMSTRNFVQCILGNHEEMLIQKKWDSERDKVYKMTEIAKLATDKEIEFIKKWPRHIIETYAACSALYIHGGPDHFTNEYVYPDTDFSKYNVNYSFVFMGHSHYSFIRKSKGVTFVNVGSCGMPRDNGMLGSFATFDPDACEVALYRFNLAPAVEKLIKSPLEIHVSVLDLFKRSASAFEGELIDTGN